MASRRWRSVDGVASDRCRVRPREAHHYAIDANATRESRVDAIAANATHRYRAQVPEVRAHAWFQQKLPPYLRHAPDRIENLERVIDEVGRSIDEPGVAEVEEEEAAASVEEREEG